MVIKNIKYKIEFYFFKLLIGLSSQAFLGRGLKHLINFLLNRIFGYRIKVIQGNISNSFPNLKPSEHKRIKNEYYKHLADSLIDGFKGLSMSKKALLDQMRFENVGLLQSLLAQHNGIILMGSHYANWEWPAVLLPEITGFDVIGVYKPLSNPYSESYVKERRSRFGFKLVAMAKSLRYMIENKSKKSIYLFISDQSPSSSNQVCWIPFLNQHTAFLNGGTRMAKKFDYPVVFMDTVPDKNGKLVIDFTLIAEAGKTRNPCEITSSYAGMLEERIQHEPQFWLWSHKRWKLNKK